MKNKVTPFLLFVLMMTFSCYDTGHSTNEETADDLIFPKGELITNKNLFKTDSDGNLMRDANGDIIKINYDNV